MLNTWIFVNTKRFACVWLLSRVQCISEQFSIDVILHNPIVEALLIYSPDHNDVWFQPRADHEPFRISRG